MSPRFLDAVAYAADAHAGQVRKSTNTPYLAHLLAVAALVLEHGGTEDEAVAALLHDAAEDAGGRARLDDIRRRFGPAVADVVEGCTDAYTEPKPPWRPRKETHLARLAQAPPSVHLVAAADKLHNVRTLLADHHEVGSKLWERFRGGKNGTLWYYRTAAATLTRAPGPLLRALGRAVAELEARAAADGYAD
jgi:(p)ppGpp synthase/HD superfamily hydrolase